MSKSTLKLKYFNIFNLTNYFQSLSDDIMQDEEDIIDIINGLNMEELMSIVSKIDFDNKSIVILKK